MKFTVAFESLCTKDNAILVSLIIVLVVVVKLKRNLDQDRRDKYGMQRMLRSSPFTNVGVQLEICAKRCQLFDKLNRARNNKEKSSQHFRTVTEATEQDDEDDLSSEAGYSEITESVISQDYTKWRMSRRSWINREGIDRIRHKSITMTYYLRRRMMSRKRRNPVKRLMWWLQKGSSKRR